MFGSPKTTLGRKDQRGWQLDSFAICMLRLRCRSHGLNFWSLPHISYKKVKEYGTLPQSTYPWGGQNMEVWSMTLRCMEYAVKKIITAIHRLFFIGLLQISIPFLKQKIGIPRKNRLYIFNRYRQRFFVQVGHQTTLENKHFFTKYWHRQTYHNY